MSKAKILANRPNLKGLLITAAIVTPILILLSAIIGSTVGVQPAQAQNRYPEVHAPRTQTVTQVARSVYHTCHNGRAIYFGQNSTGSGTVGALAVVPSAPECR